MRTRECGRFLTMIKILDLIREKKSNHNQFGDDLQSWPFLGPHIKNKILVKDRWKSDEFKRKINTTKY